MKIYINKIFIFVLNFNKIKVFIIEYKFDKISVFYLIKI